MKSILCMVLCVVLVFSAQVPQGWGDFKFGLKSNRQTILGERLQAAVDDGVQVEYRYAYVDNGVNADKCDPDHQAHSMNYLFHNVENPIPDEWSSHFANESKTYGVNAAYVIYMLQEDQGNWKLQETINDEQYLTNFFEVLRRLSVYNKGHNPIYVIEPDTWGNVLNDAGMSSPENIPAAMSKIVDTYPFLAGLPDNLCGVAQGIIRAIKHYDPDAYCGLLASHWAVGADKGPTPDAEHSSWGIAWFNDEDMRYSAEKNAEFMNKLLGDGKDRGDFMGIEKNGHSAGYWLVNDSTAWVAAGKEVTPEKQAQWRRYYWNDEQNARYLEWCKILGEKTNLPLLGWQISIGHMGLPNTGGSATWKGTTWPSKGDAYEDTYFSYFFNHVQAFINAGFIGFLAGEGLDNETDYTLKEEGDVGDRGWFFEQLAEFDKGRPYLGEESIVTGGKSVAFTPQVVINTEGVLLRFERDAKKLVELYSLSGRLITQKAIAVNVTSATLPLHSLASGVYLLKICSDDMVSTKRIRW